MSHGEVKCATVRLVVQTWPSRYSNPSQTLEGEVLCVDSSPTHAYASEQRE